MPAKSKAQQKAAGAALAAKRGDQKVSDLKGPAKSMYQSMSEEQLEEMASTKRKGKPPSTPRRRSECRRAGKPVLTICWPDLADVRPGAPPAEGRLSSR